jgi:hypothetical protein
MQVKFKSSELDHCSMASVPPAHVVRPDSRGGDSTLPVIGVASSSSAFSAAAAAAPVSHHAGAHQQHLEDSQLLYNKTVPVRVASAQRDTAQTDLTVTIVLRTVHAHQKQQALLFQLTDEVWCCVGTLEELHFRRADLV